MRVKRIVIPASVATFMLTCAQWAMAGETTYPVKALPEAGATIAFLGLAILGVELIRRRFRR